MSSMNYTRIARKYDLYVKGTFDLEFWLAETRKSAGPVLELTAGTGRVSLPLVEAGIDLTCVDNSPEMLAILREKLRASGFHAECIEQDITRLALGRQYDLIFIPFHSFAELLTREDQELALARIHEHLAPGGRFICTLHNPPVRMRSEDGRLRLYGRFPLADEGTLLLWGLSTYTPGDPLVSGVQLYEEYDGQGILHEKSFVDVRFRLVTREEFQTMATAVGFTVLNLYGDYAYAPFDAETSPFMIWELGRQS